MDRSALLRATDGALLGLVVALLAWNPLVYAAIARAYERDGFEPPRHLPGLASHAAVCALAGVAANVGFASHLAAIPAAVIASFAVAGYHDLPGRFRAARARRAERRRLRRELAGTE